MQPSQWLKDQFEFENCSECGGDVRDHLETELLGNPFAYCRTEVFDNGGITFDQYTVIIDEEFVFGMSVNPTSPQGFNQFCGKIGKGLFLVHLRSESGDKKLLYELPKEVQEAIRLRYLD